MQRALPLAICRRNAGQPWNSITINAGHIVGHSSQTVCGETFPQEHILPTCISLGKQRVPATWKPAAPMQSSPWFLKISYDGFLALMIVFYILSYQS